MKRGTFLLATSLVLAEFVCLAGLAGGGRSAQAAPAGGAAPTAASAPTAGAQATSQPTTIPGKWKVADQPLPPQVEVLNRVVERVPVYGLYCWCGEYKTHRQNIQKVGWKAVRVGGPMDDESFAMMEADGMEVMKTLGLRDIAGADGNQRNRNDYASDDAFIADYIKGIQAFLRRYGPKGTFFQEKPKGELRVRRPVKHVEMWNEPNFQYMIPDSNDRKKDEAQREALYAKVLPAVYEAIKKDWPDVTVVGFGAGGASAGDLRFIKNVLAANPKVAASFDVLSTHPYVPPAPPETDAVRSWGSYSIAKSLDAIRKNLAEHKAAEKPIWYTEVGWPISKADGGYFATKGDDFVSPLLQAAYVCRLYAYAVRLGVERVHIMFATDTDNYNAGFFLRDGQWRPSATAVQTMIRLIPAPRLESIVSDGADGYYAYSFYRATTPHTEYPGDTCAVMAWNVAGPKTVSIPFASRRKPILVDMLGVEKPLVAKDGKVTVEVGPLPVYIRE